MWYFLTHLFDTTDFPARWHCGDWSDAHGYLHIVSDLGVWSAYVAIPCVLLYFAYRKKTMPFRYVLVLFGAFILSCGATHLMEALIFWWPAYRLAGLVKLITAIVSWSTVIALVPIAPRVLAMKSPQELDRTVQERTAALKREIDERRRTENVLLGQRELFRVTLASIGDGVIATDGQGLISFINPVAEQLTGWASEEALGKRLPEVLQLFDEYTEKVLRSPFESVARGGDPAETAQSAILQSRDGSRRPVDERASPILSQDRVIVGVVLVFRDATEQRKATADQTRLAAIVENSDDAIIGLDLAGRITSWNNGAQALFGYPPEEAIGQSIQLIIPPERASELSNAIQRLENGERVEHYDTVRIRKNGTRVDVSSRISPIKDAAGRVVGASKVSHDIGARKHTERSLRFLSDTSTALSSLVDYEGVLQRIARLAVPFFADYCVIDTIDANGSIEPAAYAHADQATEGVLREAVDKYPLSWDSDSVAARVLISGEAELTSHMTPEMVDRVVRDSEHRRLLDTLAPRSSLTVPIVIRDRPFAAIQFVTSRSGRTYSEADQALGFELARRAAIAIENAQLYRELKEAQRQKDDFLAMLAHELRNPLAAINFANQVAKTTAAVDDVATEVIERQLKVLTRLIDDLLDVSRITRGKIHLKQEHVDGAAIVSKAVATIKPLVDERKHHLSVSLPEEPLPLLVDPTRVEQILVNLLSNAAKYTPEGGTISVSCFAQYGRAIFQVKDNGIGIPRDMLPRVFDLFTQVDKSLDRSQGGLGIGLTVVRRLAELHGGAVAVASEGLGQGSLFSVQLPLADPIVAAPIPQAVEVAPLPLQRILVVDDNVDMARTIATLLRHGGHTVSIAHDGEAALESAASFQPDVMLLDLGLPGLDGYHVAQRLRRDPRFQRLRLIALSGYGQAEDRKRSQAAGFDRHLVKPVDFETLINVIGDAVAQQPAAD